MLFTSIGQEELSLLAAVSYLQAVKLLSKHLSKNLFKIRCVLLVLRRPNYGVFFFELFVTAENK